MTVPLFCSLASLSQGAAKGRAHARFQLLKLTVADSLLHLHVVTITSFG